MQLRLIVALDRVQDYGLTTDNRKSPVGDSQ
jgi:hypothetical protein